MEYLTGAALVSIVLVVGLFIRDGWRKWTEGKEAKAAAKAAAAVTAATAKATADSEAAAKAAEDLAKVKAFALATDRSASAIDTGVAEILKIIPALAEAIKAITAAASRVEEAARITERAAADVAARHKAYREEGKQQQQSKAEPAKVALDQDSIAALLALVESRNNGAAKAKKAKADTAVAAS